MALVLVLVLTIVLVLALYQWAMGCETAGESCELIPRSSDPKVL